MAERSTVNSEYWERRFQTIESENHQKAKLTAADTIEAYKEACRNCQKEIEAWYGRFAQNNGITIAEARTMLSKQELEELKWDAEQYIKALEDNEISGKWVKELENASARYHISKYEGLQIRLRQQIEAAAAVEQGNLMHHLTDVYGETMYKTAYEMQSGLNTGFEIAKVNEQQINAVLNRPWAADGKAFSDRIWQRKEELKQKLDNEITRNIMLGKGVKDSTMSVAREFGVTENRAATLVYTETAYVASEAQKAQFKELGVEQFEIVATLDNHTSAICQEMDGKHMPMSDFKSGVTAPPFHPNCRSVTVPYLDDEFREIFGEGERAARDENGKTVSVPEDMTYPEWKKVFVDKSQTMDEWTAAKEAAKAAASVEVPKTIAFKPAESIEAAEEYAKKFISDGYSPTFKNQAVYKGISLEHANEINKTLEELYSEYDLPPISGIKVISPTSAQGKKVFKDGADAVAAYNPTEKGLFINKDVLKNAKTLEAYNKKAREAYDYVLDNIDSLKGSQRELAETYKKAGRSLVGDGSVKSHITHEIGHHVQWDVLSTDVNNSMGKNMTKYAPQISGYANASKGEYIAESFAAYVRGERDILDPDFVQYLDKNVVKGVAKSAERGIIKAEGSSTIAFAKRIPNKSVKSRIINEAIAAEKPVYAENLRTVYKNVKPKENFYDVVLHGTQFYTEYEDEYIIDVDTLVNIIKGRKDYQMSDIRLLSCSTGEKDKFGNCFAQQLANKLNVRVYAPKEQLNIHSNGVLTVGDEYIDEDLGFELFNPETSRGD